MSDQKKETPTKRPSLLPPAHAGGVDELVKLDPDHPGFRDLDYRARRNAIAKQAVDYLPGQKAPHVSYSDDEHVVWQTVWQHLAPLHQRYACKEVLSCEEALTMDRMQIPQLEDINQQLVPKTGFRMLPVAGLVSARTFLSYLADDVFLSTQYIRHPSVPLYTPEPDIVHELVGHAATLSHPDFAKLNRAFGQAVKRANEQTMERIALVYWYTLEFGVVEENGTLKVYGAGLLSSFGELERFEKSAQLVPLDFDHAASTPYDPSQYQPTLFVAPSFAQLTQSLLGWLDNNAQP